MSAALVATAAATAANAAKGGPAAGAQPATAIVSQPPVVAPKELDLLTDLLDVDMSPVLKKLSSSAIGEIVPYSVSIIGANMAETFNERQFSAMNLIMTTKRTRLSDRQLEILAVLRMHRAYMRAMKKNFPKLALRLSSYHTKKIRKMASA